MKTLKLKRKETQKYYDDCLIVNKLFEVDEDNIIRLSEQGNHYSGTINFKPTDKQKAKIKAWINANW